MSKVIVTHKSPDLDAITSVWLIKRFIPGWESAKLKFVPAGSKLPGIYKKEGDAIEVIGNNEIITVDTGMGVLDHHHLEDNTICATSITYEYVLQQSNNTLGTNESRKASIAQLIDLVIDEDHFQQVFYPDSDSYIREISIIGLIDGRKMQYPAQDEVNTAFIMECLDALVLNLQSRLEAEKEIEKGKEFKTKWGKAMAFTTVNDSVMKLAQVKGYVLAVRVDPSNHLMRIKARPRLRDDHRKEMKGVEEVDIDLTPVYEIVKEKDQYASWFLHASKRMLLNGSSKNPNTVPTKLELDEIIKILEEI
jgi:hypothetical protein